MIEYLKLKINFVEGLKMKFYLGNAFSLQMLSGDAVLIVEKVTPDQIPVTAESVIGHEDTARIVGSILGREVKANRKSILLDDLTVLYVAQYKGPRLPEGATTLPEGATIEFLRVMLS